MKTDRVGIGCIVLLVTACAGVPQVASSPVSAKYRSRVRVDSAAVETILTAIMDERKKYGGTYELTVDVDADSESSSFRSVADERWGSVPNQRYDIADSALLQMVADSRRRLLTKRGVSYELRRYPGCFGHLWYRTPPDSAGRPGCPKVGQVTVAIQLPHRGEYPEIRSFQERWRRRQKQPVPVYDGEMRRLPVGDAVGGPGGRRCSLPDYLVA